MTASLTDSPASSFAEGHDSRFDRRFSEILDFATEVFAEKGYEGASMRDLSRLSGMSLAGLYYYFDSKEKLLHLIQKHAFTSIVARLRERLIDGKRLRAAEHLDRIDLAPSHRRAGEACGCFRCEDRRAIIFVGAFKAGREVHDIADDGIVEAPTRSDIADQRLAGIEPDPVSQDVALEGRRALVELGKPLAAGKRRQHG